MTTLRVILLLWLGRKSVIVCLAACLSLFCRNAHATEADQIIATMKENLANRVALKNARGEDRKEWERLYDENEKSEDRLVEQKNEAVASIDRELLDPKLHAALKGDLILVLANIKTPESAKVAQKLLSDKEYQSWGVMALQIIGPAAKDTVNDLAKIIRTKKTDITTPWERTGIDNDAIRALKAIRHGTPYAVSVLEDRLTNGRDDDAAQALSQMGELGIESLIVLSARYAQDSQKHSNLSDAYARLIHQTQPEIAIAPLTAHVLKNDETSHVAALGLGACGAPAKDALFKLLDHENERIKWLAAIGLNKMLFDVRAARHFRQEERAEPFSQDEFFNRLKALIRTKDGKTNYGILDEICKLDTEKALGDPDIGELVREVKTKELIEMIKEEERQRQDRKEAEPKVKQTLTPPSQKQSFVQPQYRPYRDRRWSRR